MVRHYKFRCPKSTDFGSLATWSIASTGELKLSAVARFSRRDPIKWQQPKLDEEVGVPDVIPMEGNESVIPRQWRYANTVAR